MTWISEWEYKYTALQIRDIAGRYALYEQMSEKSNHKHWADEKIDFDRALQNLPERLKRFMLLWQYGYTERDLRQRGYWDIKSFRWHCFYVMADFLNGET